MVAVVSVFAAGISLTAVLLIVVTLHMSQTLRPKGKWSLVHNWVCPVNSLGPRNFLELAAFSYHLNLSTIDPLQSWPLYHFN
jgi:hypothetical protein